MTPLSNDADGERGKQPDYGSPVTLKLDLERQTAAIDAVLDALPSGWSSIRHPGLSVWKGVDPESGSVLWQLPSEGFSPLSRLAVPLGSTEVRSLIEEVARALDPLHAAGVGAVDLSPDRVYVDATLRRPVIVPSPWLATTTDRPPGARRDAFLAPEIGTEGVEVEPLKADIYAIGALAWYLLTGEPRTKSGTLPREVRPELSAWDALIDGCCRSHAARRFPSLAAVRDALPAAPGEPDQQRSGASAGRAGRPPLAARLGAAPIPPGSTRRQTATAAPSGVRSGRPRAILIASVAMLAFLFVIGVLSRFGGITGTDYRQGFAGTVVRYADRDYDGASWQKLYAAANLGDLPALGVRTAKLQHIVGVDEDNLWIVDTKGIVFRMSDGHWEVAANQPDATNPLVGLIDDETLVMAGYRTRGQVYLVGLDGVRIVTYDNLQLLRPTDAVTAIAPGLSYIHSYRETYKLLEGTLTRTAPGVEKDSIVVDEYGAPVNISRVPMTPTDFRYSATLDPGEVYAVWIHRSRGVRLVEYRDGAWVMLDEISIPRGELSTLTSAWISRDDQDTIFVVLGGAGAATIYRQGEGVTRFPINTASGGTLPGLIAVWGSGAEKFWVMDPSGSVWEYTSGRWRPIIRGLLDENLRLNDAWVSATGAVFAVTDDALYRLD